MKKHILIILCFAVSIVATAQIQQGYLKTKGHIDNQGNLFSGDPIGEALVKILDRNMTTSDKKGTFKIRVHDKKYYLEEVSKTGYVIIDPDVLSKQHVLSKDKLILTLETNDMQKNERQHYFTNLTITQIEMINNLRSEAMELKAENKISEEEYNQRLHNIAAMYPTSQKLVDEMVEKYSKIDYDMLSEFDRQLIAFVINGEFNKADSLLKATDIIGKGANLADIYYYRSEIMKLQHKFDSAAYYLEKRLELDTTNLEWIMEAGMIAKNYLGNNEKSIRLFEKGLHEIAFHDKECRETALILNNELGYVYSCMGSFDNARGCYETSLSLSDEKTIDRNFYVADVYNNMGVTYANIGDVDKSIEYLDKASAICSNINCIDYYRTMQIHVNYGEVYKKAKKYDKALFNYRQALMCVSELFDGYHSDAVKLNNTIGDLYFISWITSELTDYRAEKYALNSYEKALCTSVEIYGEMHPYSADSYDNIGLIYYYDTQYIKALEYYRKAYLIRKEIFGEKHWDYAWTCKMLGIIYAEIKDYNKALEYLHKSKTIIEGLCGSEESEAMKIQTIITLVEKKQKENGEGQ